MPLPLPREEHATTEEERAMGTENQVQPPQNAVGVNDCCLKPPGLEALLLHSIAESIAN